MLSPLFIPMELALGLPAVPGDEGEYVIPAGFPMTECRIRRGLLVDVEGVIVGVRLRT